MAREIEIAGKLFKFVTTRDIAPGGTEELRELCKGHGNPPAWATSAIRSAPKPR